MFRSLRTLTLAALPLFSLSLVACTSSEEDELAGEADADESLDGKADSVEGASTYFAISMDFRRCASPMCGGYFLDRLNASMTTCHDGVKRETCYAPLLDWSQTSLPQSAQDKLVEASGRTALTNATYAIVRGRFLKKNTTTSMPDLGRFVVTEAWIADGEGAADGVFAKVMQNGIRCIAAPCPSLTEKALNSSRKANIAEIDFAPGNFTDTSIDALVNDFVAPGGIIVAGDRFSFSIQGREGKGRTATNAYRNLANAPATSEACFVGGCSSQICSDQEGVISTCEFRPEYACYQAATCERQANNECGWTSTPELQACLANPTAQN